MENDRRVKRVPKETQDRILHTLPVWARDRIAALEAERDALKQDAVWLLQRARALINRWQELYGEHQPQFLPPAHQIEWAEDASEFIDAAREKP